MTWSRISESTFPSKISSHNSWKTAQLSKMLWNNVPLTVQRSDSLSPEFPSAVSSLSLLEASCLFREYLKFIQFKSCVKSASHYFYCFNGFTDNVLKSVPMVMCKMGMWLNLVYICWMSHHYIKLYNLLIVNWAQGILNTTEYSNIPGMVV